MKPGWEEIVNYAKGIASPEVSALVEGDSEAMAGAKALREVHLASQDTTPDLWVLRAKALLVEQPATLPLLWGKLLPRKLEPGFGLRSGSATEILSFEFDEAKLDLWVQPLNEDGSRKVRGIFESASEGPLRVGTGDDWRETCDEEGQFVVDLSQAERTIRIEDMSTHQVFQVEIPNED